MAELHPDTARSAARSAMGYSQAFDGKGIDWHNAQPWPHRMELAQALDWISELGAMVLNLADRVAPEGPNVVGVSRMFDNQKALLLCLDRSPTDDEIRSLHDHLRLAPTKEQQ